MYTVATFYRYSHVENPEDLQQRYLNFCKTLDLKGLIILAREGINGGVAGTEEQLLEFKRYLESDFGPMTYRELESQTNPYPRMKVRVKDEIVSFGEEVNLQNKGSYLTPEEIEALGDDVIFIDARNDYESKIGRFKGAIVPDIKTFREFPQWVKKFNHPKDKKVVLYCTGGIRCEKATAYMKAHGFEDVNHIEGGIINYVQNYPDSKFEGRLFVFDDRLSVATGTESSLICTQCHAQTDNYENCSNTSCDAFFSACNSCMTQYRGACSKRCRNEVHAP